jgi:hypothetical protein
MHCFFIFDDCKNTRWLKADIGKEGMVAFREKPNGRSRCELELHCPPQGLPIRASGLRLGATETGANKAWYHSSIMPKRTFLGPWRRVGTSRSSLPKLPRAGFLVNGRSRMWNPHSEFQCVSLERILSAHGKHPHPVAMNPHCLDIHTSGSPCGDSLCNI